MSKKLEERVAKLEAEVKRLKGSCVKKINKKLGIGDTFELADLKWKILDITEQGYVCLADRLEDNRRFDNDFNNWESSDLRNYLNTDFYNKLINEIGEDNIVPFERDLLSLDGQTEYGKCEDKVSLINVDEYRKYRRLILNEEYYWWTITAESTKCNNDETWVRVVSPSGSIDDDCCYNDGGVRPFCIFSSSIFESEE